MRRLDILNITPNSSGPSTIEVGLDFTSIFHGKEWIDSTGTRYPFYTYDTDTGTATPAPPAGTTLLVATSFDIVDNSKYAGRYTVYTKPTSGGLASSQYDSSAGRTIIRVNELMPSGSGFELTDGYITHISTYLLSITGESNLPVLEEQTVSSRPLEFVGRLAIGWGEVMFQNQLRTAQCFAGPSAPTNPFQGQLWYDTVNSALKIKPTAANNGDWIIVNANVVGLGSSYKHTQSSGSTTWTVNHNLGLASPYIASVDFYVNTSNGVKAILPVDITFISANQLTATFSNAESGYALVRG